MTRHPRLVLILLVLALVIGLALLPAQGGQVDWWAYNTAGV